MFGIKVVDSTQWAVCYVCDRTCRIYAIQAAVGPPGDCDAYLPELPPGWGWQPTCWGCYQRLFAR
jgi:hypothetical protein